MEIRISTELENNQNKNQIKVNSFKELKDIVHDAVMKDFLKERENN